MTAADLLSALITFILGGGLVAGVSRAIKAIRDVQKGKLANSGTVLERLDQENRRLTDANEKLRAEGDAEEAEHEKTYLRLRSVEEQAARYRVQLIGAGITPYDDEQGRPRHA